MSDHILTVGDLVKVKAPYRPEEWVRQKPDGWPGFEYGIVVEVTSTQMRINGNRYRQKTPRNVALHLYDATGQLMVHPEYIVAGLLVPSYVDFHLSELVLYKIATESGYRPVSDPPDWSLMWAQEEIILQEFAN